MKLFNDCGDSFNSSVQAFPDRANFCSQTPADRCNPADENYSNCLNETSAMCVQRIENSFNGRYPSYGNCVTGFDSMLYDPNICTVSFDPCPDIVNKVEQCRLVFPATDPFSDPEVYDAQTACIESLPHVVQSKGGLTCPGTGYIPQ